MKLNKKYQLQQKIKSQRKEKSNSSFPLFFPNYQKIDASLMTEYFLQNLQHQWTSKNSRSQQDLLLITGTCTKGYTKLLMGKQSLPFPAKIQRLITHQEKFLNKGIPLLQQIFSQQELITSDFKLTNEKVQSFLAFLQEKNLRKLGQELVWRDTSTQTIVHPDAIERKEEKQLQLEIKCFVETKNDIFPLIVDDPLLLFSDVGIVIHSNDKRYKKHIGKKIIIPIINKSIPIFGEENIDTIKDKGIQRLNPLVSAQALERVKAYKLPTDECYIDDQGRFTEKVTNFGGKSAFEFTENIIETLATIGNLVNQQEIKKQIPYAKETGHRLIRKVVSTVSLDFSQLKEEFQTWLSEAFPQFQDYFTQQDGFKILLENHNPYAQKINFLITTSGDLKLFSLTDYQNQMTSAFSAFLLNQLRKGNLPLTFSKNDLIDTIFLMPEQEWSELVNQTAFSLEELLTTQKTFKIEGDTVKILDKLGGELENISWLKTKGEVFSFAPEQLRGTDQLLTLACDDSFLQILALLTLDETHFTIQNSDFGTQFIKDLLLLIFISEKDQNFNFFGSQGEKLKISPLPEKISKIKDSYGLETIRLLLAKQQKCNDIALEENFDYLKHLWNLFKVIYEQKVFDQKVPDQLRIGGKEFWIYSQWNELGKGFADEYPNTSSFVQKLAEIEDFTRKQLSWYIALIKKENKSESWLIARQIFLEIGSLLGPVIPEFEAMIKGVFQNDMPPLLNKDMIIGAKDYKIHLLFDILKGITNKKTELQLKKHVPIQLIIQANADVLHLLERYENDLKPLFKIKDILYFGANENLPTGFETFNILDIVLGIKPFLLTKEEDILEQLEREFKSKSESLEYLRSTLMALSLNPLADPVKISEKETELETLKSELQHLEIKIQKEKMMKKI